MLSTLKFIFLGLSLLITGAAYSDSETQGGELVFNNATSSSVLMPGVFSMALLKLQEMGVSIPDRFRVERFDSLWRVGFSPAQCGADEGDGFLFNESNGESSLVEESGLLRCGVYEKSKSDSLIEILTNVHRDAVAAYGENLESVYYVCISIENGLLNVDYNLKNPKARGGGPHYKVDFASSEILEKRYEQ